MPSKLEKLAAVIIEELDHLKSWLKEHIDEVGWDTASVKIVNEIITKVLESIEKMSAETEHLSSQDKKTLAIIVINKLVDLPYAPEWLEEKMISFVIDNIVEVLNKYLGKDWLTKIEG